MIACVWTVIEYEVYHEFTNVSDREWLCVIHIHRVSEALVLVLFRSSSLRAQKCMSSLQVFHCLYIGYRQKENQLCMSVTGLSHVFSSNLQWNLTMSFKKLNGKAHRALAVQKCCHPGFWLRPFDAVKRAEAWDLRIRGESWTCYLPRCDLGYSI